MSKPTLWERIKFIPQVIRLFLDTRMTAYEFAGRMIFISTIVILCGIAIHACSPSKEIEASPEPVAQDTSWEDKKDDAPQYTVDQAIDAVVRTVSADQVCYDSAQNAYLMHWTRTHDLQEDEDEDAHKRERDGWYSMTDVKFYRSANGTFFIKDIDSIPDVYVGVDVSGLPCKPGRLLK